MSFGLPEGVVLRKSVRARRMRLRLDSAKRCVELVLPMKFNPIVAKAFVWSKRRWINNALSEISPAIPFNNGQVLPICGQDVVIKVEHGEKSSKVILKDNVLHVRLAIGSTNPSPPIERFIKRHAKTVMLPILEEKARKCGGDFTRLSLRDMKSRWGSCSTNGRISLSWRLIFAPTYVMDYIIAHEVAHLIHHNHSRKFWDLCEKLSKDYGNGRDWIDCNGASLLQFGALGGTQLP